jgi:uncharacterized protein
MTLDATALTLALGALGGGFVSGIAGFGVSLVTLGIWLHVLPPVEATTMTLICAVAAQLQTIPAIWSEIEPRRVLPFVLPGLAGVPFGMAMLKYLDPQGFKLGVAALLIVFPGFMLAWRRPPVVSWGGRWADGAIGVAGGFLGGLAGLSGALPTMWATLRGWNKDQKRAIFRSFNLAVLGAALLAHTAAGHVGAHLLPFIALALPGVFVGAWLGTTVYKHLSDRNFTDIIMILLLISGLTLLAPWLLPHLPAWR